MRRFAVATCNGVETLLSEAILFDLVLEQSVIFKSEDQDPSSRRKKSQLSDQGLSHFQA